MRRISSWLGSLYRYAYNYDAAGNRTQLVNLTGSTTQTTTYGYNNGNQLTGFSGPWTDDYLFEYDSNGNQVRRWFEDDETLYNHNRENRMTSVQQTLTGSTVSYTYDALGRRIMRTDPQGSKLRYWYDGLGILMTKEKPSGSGSWRTKQVYTLKQAALGHIISERTNTAWNAQGTATAWGDKWFHFDLLGNTTGEIGPGGSVATQVDMEAFGTVLSGGQNGYRLTTKQYDPDAGLYYFNARWYQYEIVRLLERDPVPHGNLYTYCRNNPLRYFDPTGMIAIFSPSRWSLPMNLLCLYSVRRAFEKDFIEDDIREAYINDFYLHCVAACEMRKQCGWLGGFQLEGLGTAREKYLDRWSDGAGHVLGDAQANIDGIHCGSRCKNEDCSDCCADRMGYTAEHPSRRRGRTPFF